MIPSPSFTVPVIKLRQPDGSLLVKVGKPELVDPEVSVTVFSKQTGISKRHIATLCEQGLIQHRRLTPKKDSKILIPRTEMDRYRRLSDEDAVPSKTTVAQPGHGSAAKNASYPHAQRGGSILRGALNSKKGGFK